MDFNHTDIYVRYHDKFALVHIVNIKRDSIKIKKNDRTCMYITLKLKYSPKIHP